jgi:hypothetical protein
MGQRVEAGRHSGRDNGEDLRRPGLLMAAGTDLGLDGPERVSAAGAAPAELRGAVGSWWRVNVVVGAMAPSWWALRLLARSSWRPWLQRAVPGLSPCCCW